MGSRKRRASLVDKQVSDKVNISSLKDCPLSARKTRLVADTIRGLNVDKALSVLQFTPNKAARYIEKLLLNAVACYELKHGDSGVSEGTLSVKSIKVDAAVMLKRLRTAPQGRGHRIRKRSNHITLELAKAKPQLN